MLTRKGFQYFFVLDKPAMIMQLSIYPHFWTGYILLREIEENCNKTNKFLAMIFLFPDKKTGNYFL